MAALSWKPERAGSIYCSSACGARCTWAQYLEQKKEAEKVVQCLEKITGKLWTVQLIENLGWHWYVERKGLVLRHPTMSSNFYARFARWNGTGLTPECAIRNLIETMVHSREEIDKAIASLRRSTSFNTH